MLVLDDAGVRHCGVGVVDDGVALIIRRGLYFGLETHRSEVETAEAEVEELVELSRVDDFVGHGRPI